LDGTPGSRKTLKSARSAIGAGDNADGISAYCRVPYSPDTAAVRTRLDRINGLCDELEEAQHDNRKYRRLIERIRDEADAFRQTLSTHDSKQ